MDPLVIVVLAVTALFAGTVDAIAGGGGLITLPALLAAGLPPHLALGTNKGQSWCGSGSALFAFWRAGRVDRELAQLAFPLGLAGSALGARLVMLVDPDTLRPLVISLLVAAAAVMLVKKPVRERDSAPVRKTLVLALVLAFAIALYDGFFGPGTGTFLIVGFVALGMSHTQATADAKVVNFASNIAAVVAFGLDGDVVWQVALPMAAGQLVGGAIGARLALRGGAKLIRVMVLVTSGALVAKLLVDLL
jgi:uncharacterized protein